MTSLSGEALPAQNIMHYCVVVPQLSQVKSPDLFLRVSQNLLVSQTGYITRKSSQLNITA